MTDARAGRAPGTRDGKTLMKGYSDTAMAPIADDDIAPVRILDAEGRLIRVVPAADFRRGRSTAQTSQKPGLASRHER